MTETAEVIVVATFRPKPGARDDLIEAISAYLPRVHAEAGCELYAIHVADDDTVVMIEKWTSRAALADHAAGDVVASMSGDVGRHLTAPVQVLGMAPLRTDLGPRAAL